MNEETFTHPTLEQLAELFPKYDFEGFIAQGGMGAVYAARQRSLDRPVAIKVLPKEFGDDPEFRASFEAEAKAMARLNHPNLIGVYDFGETGGMPYIVMEFVEGESLYHSAHGIKVDPVQAVEIIIGICQGLGHAHSQGVIHRDIKPANVLLTAEAVPKIGDFGLARPAGKGEGGLVMGTPGYTPAEVEKDPHHADRRSDLYAVGVILYELITGLRAPFKNAASPASTLCGCDVELDHICEKAMNPIASLRYGTAEQMIADLSSWLKKRTQSTGLPAPSAHSRPSAPVRRRVAPTVIQHRKERKSFVWLIVLIVIAIAGFFGWKQFGHLLPDLIKKTDAPSSSQGNESSGKSGHLSEVLNHRGTPPARRPASGSTSAFGSTSPSGPKVPSGGISSNANESAFGSLIPQSVEAPVSSESSATPAAQAPAGPPPAEIAELDTKARQFISRLAQDRDNALAANTKDFTWGIDGWLRSQLKKEQERWQSSIDDLKAGITDNRIPEVFDTQMPGKVVEFCEKHTAKQKSIDENSHSQVDRIRSPYVERMEKLLESGDGKTASFAKGRLHAASDVEKWLKFFNSPESGE